MAIGGGSWIRVNAVDANLDARTINKIITQVLGRKTVSITKMPAVRKEIGEQYVDIVTNYVPRKNGDLRKSGRATDDGRVYWTAVSEIKISKAGNMYGGYNYALDQYERTDYTHPTYNGYQPRDHWTDVMRPGTLEWAEFIDRITDIIGRQVWP